MKERPILFSAPMVRAILEDRKTQTRRVMKKQPPDEWGGIAERFALATHCPYGQSGDRLWLRETWQYYDWTEDGEPRIRFAADNQATWPKTPEDWSERLTDIWAELSSPTESNIDNRARDRRWRPSIHMPRWASRITLEITGVRVERLQEISETDAEAEGMEKQFRLSVKVGDRGANERIPLSYRGGFVNLWTEINGTDSWIANPWVWVIEFRRIERQASAA